MNTIEMGQGRDPAVAQQADLLQQEGTRTDGTDQAARGQSRSATTDPIDLATDPQDGAASQRAKTGADRVDMKKAKPIDDPGMEGGPPDKFSARAETISASTTLAKRYLIADSKYYFRDDAKTVAFEDKGKRLATVLDDPAVAQSMVELARAKSWQSIKVKGTDDFKREAWLAASVRGMEVSGYKPSDVDLAKLEDQRSRQPQRPANEIVQGVIREHDRPVEPVTRRAGPKKAQEPPSNKLTSQQQIAVEALIEILKSRGDSDVAINMAAKLATEKFKDNRVYVGKVVDYGHAPFEHNPENDHSYYIKLTGPHGEKTVWGVDLERARIAGNAEKGDDISLTYQGMKQVTVPTKVLDDLGQPTGKFIDKPVERNTWDITRLDRLQKPGRTRALRAAEVSAKSEGKQPRLDVYDRVAARRHERDTTPAKSTGRGRPKEPFVPR